MKDYLIPKSILLGAIIISCAIFYSVTYKKYEAIETIKCTRTFGNTKNDEIDYWLIDQDKKTMTVHPMYVKNLKVIPGANSVWKIIKNNDNEIVADREDDKAKIWLHKLTNEMNLYEIRNKKTYSVSDANCIKVKRLVSK